MPVDTDIFALVDHLKQLPRLDEPSVRQVLRTSIKEAPDPGNPYIKIFTGNVDETSPVRRLELRVPVDKTTSGALLILKIRPDRGVPIAEVRQRFGPPARIEFPRASVPFDTPTYEIYDFPWGRLSFGYLPADNRVREIVFDRE